MSWNIFDSLTTYYCQVMTRNGFESIAISLIIRFCFFLAYYQVHQSWNFILFDYWEKTLTISDSNLVLLVVLSVVVMHHKRFCRILARQWVRFCWLSRCLHKAISLYCLLDLISFQAYEYQVKGARMVDLTTVWEVSEQPEQARSPAH